MKDKIDFIKELKGLKMDASQKERRNLLIASEFKNPSGLDANITAEIQLIKQRLNVIEQKVPEVKTIKKDIPILHKPIETSKFLQALSSDTNPLKFLIHDKTDGFNYSEMQKKWTDILTNYKTYFTANVKYNVIGRMKAFVGIDPQGWYFKRTSEKFKLSNTEVVNWCAQNPGKHPIMHFDSEISHFKESIKITKGKLESIIAEILVETFGNKFNTLELRYNDLDKAEFYTDVDALINGLKCIFASMKQRIANSSSIEVSFEAKSSSEGRIRIIKIIHQNSDCDKPLTKNELFGSDSGGDFKEAEKRFLQNCDWSIIAKNPDEEYNKLNILYDFANTKIKPREKINPDTIEGFTHILTFYS